jgi:hypothetical protein
MLENQQIRSAMVIGPLGEPLTLDCLPPANTTRWVARRKAQVVAAVTGGLLTLNEACCRYSLSLEEFASWDRTFQQNGLPGLHVNRIKYRRAEYSKQQSAYRRFTIEAENCRWQAAQCSDPPQARLLLSLAEAFDELAAEQACTTKSQSCQVDACAQESS